LIAIRAAQENLQYVEKDRKVVERASSLTLMVEFVNKMTPSYVKYFEHVATAGKAVHAVLDRRPRLQLYVDHICMEKYEGRIRLDGLLGVPKKQVKHLLSLMNGLLMVVPQCWNEEQKNDLKKLNWFVGMFSKTVHKK
jgi:hypothetical protein